jgi:hypothetical protein
VLDIWADRVSNTLTNGAPRLPADFVERAELGQENFLRTSRAFSREENRYAAFEAQRMEFLRQGRSVANPYALPDGPAGASDDLNDPGSGANLASAFPGAARVQSRGDAMVAWNKAAAELRAASPDGAERYFTAEDIERQADQRGAEARRRRNEADSVATGAFLPGLGGFLGEAAGMLQDPVQLATLPIGAPQAWLAGGLARRILVNSASEAAINAAVQAGVQYGAVNPYAREAGFEPDPIEAVLLAGLLGGGFGAAAPILGAAARRLYRGESVDPAVAAAARAAENAQHLADTRPAGRPMEAHLADLDRAAEAAAAGRVAEITEPSRWQASTLARVNSGAEATVFTPTGRAVGVQYRLAELDSLVASHTDDFRENPAYPHSEGIQPRDRANAMSQAGVQQIAADFQPERMAPSPESGSGPPIIGPDGVVESGNGRVLALRRVFTDPALADRRAAYLAFLQGRGLDATGMRQPVLVAERQTPLTPTERRAFAQESNARAQQGMTSTERARTDAAAAEAALPAYQGGALDLADNAAFVDGFLARLPATERADLVDSKGRASAAALGRLRGALLAAAYGDRLGPLLERFLEGGAENLKAIAGALQDAAPGWAAMRRAAARGEIAPTMDITADLVAAVETVAVARDAKLRVSDVLVQVDLDRPPLTDNGRAMLGAFFTDGTLNRGAAQRTVAARLGGYIQQAMETRPGADMFGETAPPPARVLDATGRRIEAEAVQEAAPVAPEPTTTPARDPYVGHRAALLEASADIQRGLDMPEREAADLLDAQRVAAANPGLAVPVGTGDAVGTKGAAQLLEDADDALATAAQQAACLIGAVTP